jgi:hypothetical protein
VDDDMANLIVAQLLYLDSADPTKDVTLYVNSPGGSVTAGGLLQMTGEGYRWGGGGVALWLATCNSWCGLSLVDLWLRGSSLALALRH